jgi:hypothetical protein
LPVVHQAGLFQLRQVGRNTALSQPQDFLQLGHAEFFPLEDEEQAKAVGIGRQAQRF